MGTFTKRAERWLRGCVLRLLAWASRRNPISSLPDLTSSPSILLIRPDRIGDAIISTPIIQLLRKRFPQATIGLLLGAKNAAVAELIPEINRTYVLPVSVVGAWNVVRAIRRDRYDVVINLTVKDSASAAAIAGLSKGKCKIGFAGQSAAIYDFTILQPTEPLHIVRETSLLLSPFGISPIGQQPTRDSERLRIQLGQEHYASRMVVLNISGSEPAKYWGTEHFITLCDMLQQRGIEVSIACKPEDEELAKQIVAGSNGKFIPSTRSFVQFATHLAEAALIVTPDTSIVHLSAALGKPTVVLAANASHIAAWQPWGILFRMIDGNGDLTNIPAHKVLTAIVELLPAFAKSNEPATTQ